MSKKFLGLTILLLVIAVLISGCGKKSETKDNAGENQNQASINPSGSYSISELLGMNKPMKCTWQESLTEGGEVTNIIYINGKKFYQDVTMGDMGHVYSISDGEYLYVWNDFTNLASKMNLKQMEAENTEEQATSENTANLEQKRDFICEKWSGDEAIFNPPVDKNFEDITEEMNQAVEESQSNSAEYLQPVCDLCQSAPTPELKNECLTNAGCN